MLRSKKILFNNVGVYEFLILLNKLRNMLKFYPFVIELCLKNNKFQLNFIDKSIKKIKYAPLKIFLVT